MGLARGLAMGLVMGLATGLSCGKSILSGWEAISMSKERRRPCCGLLSGLGRELSVKEERRRDAFGGLLVGLPEERGRL